MFPTQCELCGKDWKTCPHSAGDVQESQKDARLRQVIREELVALGLASWEVKQRNGRRTGRVLPVGKGRSSSDMKRTHYCSKCDAWTDHRDYAHDLRVCSCGNRYDGDNLCMVSASQWEEAPPRKDGSAP